MTWVRSLQPTRPAHRCALPKYGDPGVPGQPSGSVWQCDDCGQQWLCRLEHDQREQPEWWLRFTRVTAHG